MTLLITRVLTLVYSGSDRPFLLSWRRRWLLAWPVAVPTIAWISRWLRRWLSQWIVPPGG